MRRQGSISSDSLTVLAAALCGTMMTGCSGPTEITVGSAPATAATLSIAEPDRSGWVPLSTWPQACELLTDADVHAILPTATKVDSNPKGLEMTNLDVNSPQRNAMANGALCATDVWIADVADPDEKATTLEVRVRMAGTPKLAEANYNRFVKQIQPCPSTAEAIRLDDCSRSGSSWAFLRGGLAVEFAGHEPTLGEDARYQGQQGDDDSVVWNERVIPEFVKAIAAKLPPS
jgi:hypothetical protein